MLLFAYTFVLVNFPTVPNKNLQQEFCSAKCFQERYATNQNKIILKKQELFGIFWFSLLKKINGFSHSEHTKKNICPCQRLPGAFFVAAIAVLVQARKFWGRSFRFAFWFGSCPTGFQVSFLEFNFRLVSS